MSDARKTSGWAVKLVAGAALMLVWQITACLKHQPSLYPKFGYIVTVSLPGLGVFSNSSTAGFRGALDVLCYNGGVTVFRIAIGLGIGVPVGIAGGLAIHYLRGDGPVSSVTLTIIRSVPLLALIPLFKYWFALSPAGPIAYIAVGTFFVLASDSYEAAANISPIYAQQAHLLGAGPWFTLRTVYLPGIQLQLAGGLRNVIGLSWAFSLGAEYISAQHGLGAIAYEAYSNTDMGQLAILAALYAVLGYGSYEVARYLVSALTPWQKRGVEEFK